MNLSVSIVTITQFKRYQCLEVLFETIKAQTYTNIIEWVIVEGSKSESDAESNKILMEEFVKSRILQCSIKYITRTKQAKLGELRNIGNNICKGDITVCMDDDDYYFPDRVEHAVSKLSNSKYLIAGCSKHLMYDYDLDMFVQMSSFGLFHSINSCMAWKKEYLLSHSHDPEKEFGEEASFTNHFTEPMIQLDPYSTVIISSHKFNTFNKKLFFIKLANKMESSIDHIIHKPIRKYIPQNILNKYKNIFTNKKENIFEYDIVYMCGCFSITWDPSDQKLGGSEQAVVYLSENWVRFGKSVIVYGEVPGKVLNGVVYKPYYEFDYNRRYKNLIIWRIYGLVQILPFNITADKILYDAHDNFTINGLELIKKYYLKVNTFMLKSNYHKECFLKNIDNNFKDISIIPNGVRINKFSMESNEVRNPYRFCYCSCYTRGLDNIISKLWPVIYEYEPRVELHVYYGMDGIQDENLKQYYNHLLSSKGVMDHGRQPADMIAREKHMSTFHFYITNTEKEIDCISIKESVIAGCIPLLSNFGVFKERLGVHFDINNDTDYKISAIKIIDLLKHPEKVEALKKSFEECKDISSWTKTSAKWIDVLT